MHLPPRFADRLPLVMAVMVSVAIHLVLVYEWLAREPVAPTALAMQTVTVDLLALVPPAATVAPPEAIVEPAEQSVPIDQPLPEAAMAERPIVTPKPRPPKPIPQKPVDMPAKPAAHPAPAPSAAAPVNSTTPAPMPVSAARYDADYLKNPPPVYPPLSRRLGEQGKVLLRVKVSENGEPLAVEVFRGSGHARLDEAARKAAGRWRFVPARQGNVAVTSWVEVPIQFSLDQ